MARPRRTAGIGIYLLFLQLFNVGFDNIPPVTLIAILAQAAIYLRLMPIPWRRSDMCVSNFHVLHNKQWPRLVLATFEHGDDMHLYYNMVSFLWKGSFLERKYGRCKYFVILAAFSVLTNVVYLGLNHLAKDLTGDSSYIHQCAVGFSGVIFALKVLKTHHSSSSATRVFGLQVPTNLAYWFELVIISVLVPNASFIGHLAGIIVGLAYTKGPLKMFLKPIYKFLEHGFRPRYYTYSSGTSGYYSHHEDSRYASASQYEHTYPPRHQGDSAFGFTPNPEQLRAQRLQYYE